MSFRTPIVAAALAALMGSGAASGTALARTYRTLTGRVVDGEGEGIGGANVIVTPIAPRHPNLLLLFTAGSPASGRFSAVRSRPDGGFSALLPEGRYSVAAYKNGYDVALSAVNTRARAFLELELQRAARIVLGDLPVGSAGQELGLSWILRRSTGGVLHEREESVAGPPVASRAAHSGWLGEVLGPVDGEFRQRFSGAARPGGEDAAIGDTAGRTTALALSGAIEGLGTWRFLGRSGKAVATLRGGAVRRDRSSDLMRAGVDLDLGAADALTAEIEYGTHRFVVDSREEAVGSTDQEQRTIGLRSRWDRRLGGVTRLFVDAAYFETGVRVPQAGAPLAPADGTEIGRLTDRSWLATAGMAIDSGDHRLDFALRTSSYRYDLRDLGVMLNRPGPGPTLAEPGTRGNALSLFAGDDWRVADGYVVNYGFGYHANLSAGGTYIVPRIGLTRRLSEDGATLLRSMVMFRLNDAGRAAGELRAGAGGSVDRDRAGRVGYLIALERRSGDRLRLSATFRYQPFEEGLESGGPHGAAGEWGDALPLLTDGAAGRREFDLELAHAIGDFRGSISGSVGRVRGRLTPAVEEAPVQILMPAELRYYATRLRAVYAPTETELQVGYQWMMAEDRGDPLTGSGEIDFRRLDLVIYQDLPWLQDTWNADWKVLMAYQDLAYGTLFDGSGRAVPVSASRLTGGVDIRF
ncbi:MAG: hypothetical protein ACE5JH_02225 [Acidobacteriota bacterium]